MLPSLALILPIISFLSVLFRASRGNSIYHFRKASPTALKVSIQKRAQISSNDCSISSVIACQLACPCDATTMPSLPSELLFYIFAHFREPWIPDDTPFASTAVDSGHQTLASVCLVSKTFRDIAQPFLYRQFRTRTPAGGSQGDALAEWNRQLRGFVRTITDRPDPTSPRWSGA